jgi:hypothetical protein
MYKARLVVNGNKKRQELTLMKPSCYSYMLILWILADRCQKCILV